jgi:O-antigen/teichoic acid export membrane protein
MKLRLSKTMRDIQWSFISLAISSFVHFLLRVVLGRELGASGLGLYTLVFTIYMFGMQFAAFGIGAALTKYVAEHNENLNKIEEFVSSGVIGSFISGLTFGIILYLSSNAIAINFFHCSEMAHLLKITAFCFPFIALQKTILGTLNGLRKMNYFALVNIVQNVSVFALSVVLVLLFEMNVTGAVFGFVLPTIVMGPLALVFIKDFFKVPSKLFNTVLRELSWFGFYVVLVTSMSMVYTQIDTLLIGHFMNEVEVGYYAVAVVLIQGITLLPGAIQRVTTPAIASYYGKNEYENIRKLIKKTMAKTFLITIFFSLLLAIFGKFLIGFLFTEEFLFAYPPLLILLIGYSVSGTYNSIGGAFTSVGKLKTVFILSIFSVVSNTILNLVLIPKYGIIGAASATSFSLTLSVMICMGFLRKFNLI